MARQWIPDELWRIVEPLLPKEPPKPKGGRPRIPDRQCLLGIVFILRTGAAWNAIPAELDCGSGPTCWRRFHEWSQAGLWPAVWKRILKHLGKQGKIDSSVAVIDSASQRAVFGGPTPARTRRIVRRTAPSAT